MAKKQINISLPSYVLDRLIEEADAQGRKAPDLAAFFVEHMMHIKGLLPAAVVTQQQKGDIDCKIN